MKKPTCDCARKHWGVNNPIPCPDFQSAVLWNDLNQWRPERLVVPLNFCPICGARHEEVLNYGTI
jgi:hypothetical protein